jgi:hypothetical protein
MYIDGDNFTTWMEQIIGRLDKLKNILHRFSNIRNCLDGEKLLENQY